MACPAAKADTVGEFLTFSGHFEKYEERVQIQVERVETDVKGFTNFTFFKVCRNKLQNELKLEG